MHELSVLNLLMHELFVVNLLIRTTDNNFHGIRESML